VKAGFRIAAAAALIALLGACQASVNANAEANVSGEGASAEADGSADLGGKGELTRTTSDSAGLIEGGAQSELPSSRVLLGARHDLKLSAGKSTATCRCLNVALGAAQSPGMAWSSTPPQLDDSTQLSIALSSDGVDCKEEPKGSLGASYWGYRISGNDVIVLVEAARGGRPLTSGAVIPRPVGPGRVFVAPASKKLPYGRPLDGAGNCKIGNPGPIRSSAFTELELGTDAPAVAQRSKADDTPSIEMQGN
jgi:hypothetical protein